jgi:hypothetical protein
MCVFSKNYYFYPTLKNVPKMKKLFPLAAIAVFAVMFTSCKKDYTCTCTQTVTGSTPVTTTVSLGKQTKSDADKACSNYNVTSSAGGTSVTTSCHL